VTYILHFYDTQRPTHYLVVKEKELHRVKASILIQAKSKLYMTEGIRNSHTNEGMLFGRHQQTKE
jgi:hypothetical protein